MRPRVHCCLLAGIVPLVVAATARAQEWTRFRGPNGTGIGQGQGLPVQWQATEWNWKVQLPGEGHGSPVLWGDKLFLLSADPKSATRYVLCLSIVDGRELWRREFASEPHRLHQRNTYASSTPVVDAERVYVAWTEPKHVTLRAFDHAGRDVWQQDLGNDVSEHGFGTSPIRFDDLVILSNSQQEQELEGDQQPGKSLMMAFDARSGQLRWSTPRVSVRVCYSTPCLYEPPDGPPELICTNTGDGAYSLDPRTGRENWKVAGAFAMRVVSSPVLAGGLVFGSTGSGGGGGCVTAVRPGPQAEIAYTIKNAAPYVATMVAHGDLLFLCGDKGVVACVNPRDGEAYWRERVTDAFYSSPVIADDKLYCVSEAGVVYVLAAGKEFRVLGENPLGELTRATPAIAGGRLYFRTKSQLFSVGGKQRREPPRIAPGRRDTN
jgi:outer membrane protein assembly factor BamB